MLTLKLLLASLSLVSSSSPIFRVESPVPNLARPRRSSFSSAAGFEYPPEIAGAGPDAYVEDGVIHRNVVLDDGYDLNEVPTGDEGLPLVVNFSLNLANILAIDEPNQVS